MIFREPPTSQWEAFDFALAEAYQTLQDETCPLCGNYLWLCRSGGRDVDFKVETITCHASRALEAYKDKSAPKDQRASKEVKASWGKSYSTTPYVPPMSDRKSLPTRREYYESMR